MPLGSMTQVSCKSTSVLSYCRLFARAAVPYYRLNIDCFGFVENFKEAVGEVLNAKSKCIEDLIAKPAPEDEGADVVETAIAAFGYALGEQNAGVSKEGIVNGALPFLFHQMSYQHLLNFDGTSVSYSGLQAAFRQFKCVRALHISVAHWAHNIFCAFYF